MPKTSKPAVRGDVNRAIEDASRSSGLSPQYLHAIADIESSHNPNVTTGSYKGLLQLDEDEFRKYGGEGSIYDPAENAKAGAAKIVAENAQLSKRLGRPITEAESYMAHQQGVAGAASHINNPDQPAWRSFQSASKWSDAKAKRAIWGNLTPSAKAQFGSVENVTSGEFVEWWRQRYARGSSKYVTRVAAVKPAPTDTSPESKAATVAHYADIKRMERVERKRVQPRRKRAFEEGVAGRPSRDRPSMRAAG
jgi:hypothetical protein